MFLKIIKTIINNYGFKFKPKIMIGNYSFNFFLKFNIIVINYDFDDRSSSFDVILKHVYDFFYFKKKII